MTSQNRSRPLMAAIVGALLVGAPAGYLVAAGTRPATTPTDAPKPHAAMSHDMNAATPAARAFREASARMHAEMAVAPTGDVDLDFARGMVPHHHGAVDMARIELEHGRDPAMRRLAETVVATQTAEITTMERWIAERAAKTTDR